MESIYIIEQVDFSVTTNTKDQEVSISQVGYVKDEQTAVKVCEKLKGRSDKRGISYYIEGEEGSYPRFTFQKIDKIN